VSRVVTFRGALVRNAGVPIPIPIPRGHPCRAMSSALAAATSRGDPVSSRHHCVAALYVSPDNFRQAERVEQGPPQPGARA